MDKNDSRNNRERGQRDWLLFLLLLLLGFGCMLSAAQIAINPPPSWRVPADMLSELDPDKDSEIGEMAVVPLRPEVMTPFWDIDAILTPGYEGTLAAAPTVVPGPPPTSTPTPQGVAGASPTPSASPIAPIPSPTPTPIPTGTPTPTSTSTPTPTGTSSPTPTGTFTPTSPPPPPPPTNTPIPPTNTPVPPTPTSLPPIVQAITPDTRVNTGAVGVTISGQNFQAGCSASLDGVSLAVSNCAPTTILASVPLDIVAGYYDLTVTNPDSQSGAPGAFRTPAGWCASIISSTLTTGERRRPGWASGTVNPTTGPSSLG